MYTHSKDEDVQRTNIYLPIPMLKKLQTLAKAQGVSVAELIRNAINQWLK